MLLWMRSPVSTMSHTVTGHVPQLRVRVIKVKVRVYIQVTLLAPLCNSPGQLARCCWLTSCIVPGQPPLQLLCSYTSRGGGGLILHLDLYPIPQKADEYLGYRVGEGGCYRQVGGRLLQWLHWTTVFSYTLTTGEEVACTRTTKGDMEDVSHILSHLTHSGIITGGGGGGGVCGTRVTN